jgi:hypothetical protein
MVKEKKEFNTQNSHQEGLTESEFGFVYDFFTGKEKRCHNAGINQRTTKVQLFSY